MKDDLKKKEHGRWPKLFFEKLEWRPEKNGRRPQKKNGRRYQKN